MDILSPAGNGGIRPSRNFYMSKYISRLLHDSFCIASNSFMAPMAAGDMMAGRGPFSLMLFYQDRFAPQMSIFGSSELAAANFTDDLSDALNEKMTAFVSEVDGFTVAIAFLPQEYISGDDGDDRFCQLCRDIALPLIERADREDMIRFRCLYLGPITSLGTLAASYDLIHGVWEFRKFFLGLLPSPVFTRVNGTPVEAHENSEEYCARSMRRLCQLLKEDTKEQTLEYASEVMEHIFTLEPQTFTGLRINLQCLCTTLRWTLMTNSITIADGFGQYSASIIRAVNHNQLRRNFADCIETLYDDYRSQPSRTQMEDIVEYIDENLQEQWLSVQSVSDRFGISPSLLSTQFKLRTGQRPIDYIHTKRMELAVDYLRETDMSIRDISIKVGYGSIATMNRSFRNYAGVTPSWIRQHSKNNTGGERTK